MKYQELPKEMQKDLLKGTRKTLVVASLIVAVIFFLIAALIASIGHNMWVIALFPALIGFIALVNMFIELKAPSNFLDKSIKSADYSLNSFEPKSN